MLLIADATRLFLDAMDDIKPEDIPGNFVIETFEKCQFLFESRTIPQDSGIGSREAGPVRARGMDAPSQRENFNRRNTLSISRIAKQATGRLWRIW